MESKIDQNDDYFFRKSSNLVSDSKFKIRTIFRKLHSRFSNFREKKLSGQIVVWFPVSTYKSQCFKELYDFTLGHGSNGRMGLKKDMRNDNLFFKRVTDIIIPDNPLSIDM